MQLLLNKPMKHHWVQNAAYYNKLRALLRRVFPNYISFTTSLISASRKTCAFYVNEISIGPYMWYTRRVSVITVTGLPFDQMEPSRSMQTRSGNPVRTPKLERDFPDFWIKFYAGFYEWVNDRLMTNNNYKQYFASSGVYFGLLYKITLNHQGPYNSKMNRY